jgi:hypothetical protein
LEKKENDIFIENITKEYIKSNNLNTEIFYNKVSSLLISNIEFNEGDFICYLDKEFFHKFGKIYKIILDSSDYLIVIIQIINIFEEKLISKFILLDNFVAISPTNILNHCLRIDGEILQFCSHLTTQY